MRLTILAFLFSTSAVLAQQGPAIDVNKAFEVFQKQRNAAQDAAAKAELEKLVLEQELAKVKAELEALKKLPDEK